MPKMIEQTTTGKTTTKWWSNYLTPQTMFWICAGFVWAVVFWKDSKENWAKIGTKADESEIVTLKEQVKDLEERVNRQYSTARDDREKENKAIEEVADWMHYQRGYKQAMDDIKNKK